MTGKDARSRRAAAAAAAGRLAETIKLEGDPSAYAWYLKLLDIRDVLDSPASDEQALAEAAVMFDALYEGPRNFSDFNIWRKDVAARVRENKRVEDDMRILEESLSS